VVLGGRLIFAEAHDKYSYFRGYPFLQPAFVMEIRDRKIKVHKLLHELFGRETTRLDLFAILIGSIALTIAVQIRCLDSELSVMKKMLLAFLTLDIGGGVIANFTEGTNNYYSESLKRRYLFILVHVLQPLILAWIFPKSILTISVFTLYTLINALIITSIKKNTTQRIIAITMLLIGILLTYFFSFSNPMLQLISIVFLIKLILAFSVNWKN
jgi:hypothetical protein